MVRSKSNGTEDSSANPPFNDCDWFRKDDEVRYGLAEEELDLIVNYDAEYRLGRDAGEEEE